MMVELTADGKIVHFVVYRRDETIPEGTWRWSGSTTHRPYIPVLSIGAKRAHPKSELRLVEIPLSTPYEPQSLTDEEVDKYAPHGSTILFCL